jgi:hypothetical protein
MVKNRKTLNVGQCMFCLWFGIMIGIVAMLLANAATGYSPLLFVNSHGYIAQHCTNIEE